MTKKEIATMVADAINGLEAGMAMVGEKNGQPCVIIGKESVRPSFNITDDVANRVNACKGEDIYVALAEVAADMRAQYNVASKANPVTRDNILKTAKVCLRRVGSGKETDVVKPFAQGIEKYIRVDASCVQEDSSFVLADVKMQTKSLYAVDIEWDTSDLTDEEIAEVNLPEEVRLPVEIAGRLTAAGDDAVAVWLSDIYDFGVIGYRFARKN